MSTHADALQDAGAPCVSWQGEARMTGYGFRHVVVLKSACKVNKACDVSSDVNPEVQKISIAPSETKEVVTNIEAVGATFTPRVSCK